MEPPPPPSPRPVDPFKVLVFSKTAGYRHASIPAGVAALQRLAAASSTADSASPAAFVVDASEDAAACVEADALRQYRVLVLLQTSGDFLDGGQLAALKAHVRGGGAGVVAVHCAAAGMPSSAVDADGWYAGLVGARFDSHPKPQPGRVRALDPAHPILARGAGLQAFQRPEVDDAAGGASYAWDWFDEWYDFEASPREKGVHVLLAVDEGLV